jgi:hypothetical protein
MFTLSCDGGCGTIAYADCSCPEGYDPHTAGHLPNCQMVNLDALVVCPPASDCCKEDHDHAAVANACEAAHTTPCVDPLACKLWANVLSHQDPDVPNDLPASCPGGHCGVGVPGCTVCRPITVIVPPGHVGGLKRAAV